MLFGIDLPRLLDKADWMRAQCGEHVPVVRNPGMALGAVLGEAALGGRNKLTIVSDASLSAFAGWIEQIIAESSGKNGKGILPVPLEPLGEARAYGKDRLFVYLRKTGEHDETITALRNADHPVIQLPITNFYDIGAEMFRWEIATVVACSIIGVNAFGQPNVESSKKITKAKIADYQRKGRPREGKPAWKKAGVAVFAPTPGLIPTPPLPNAPAPPVGPVCAPDNAGLKLPPGFCALLVAEGLGPVRHLAVAPNGDIVAAKAGQGGGVVILRDGDGDGRAEQVAAFYGEAGGSGLVLTREAVFFAANDRVLKFPWKPGDLTPGSPPVTVATGLPSGGHASKGLALRGNDLFVSFGSRSNSCQKPGEDRRGPFPGESPCPELLLPGVM